MCNHVGAAALSMLMQFAANGFYYNTKKMVAIPNKREIYWMSVVNDAGLKVQWSEGVDVWYCVCIGTIKN